MQKITFCPGPGALIPEWTKSQKEFFGRNDKEYQKIKNKTLQWLKKISQKDFVIPIAGSGSNAAVVAINTFLTGKILIVNTGYYSNRWFREIKNTINYTKIYNVKYEDLKFFNKEINYILFVYVETGLCKKFDIQKIFDLKKKFKAKLIIDAVASIGLEENHKLADVVFFSSCKGLFGPTGLGFIGYNKNCRLIKAKSFIANYVSHQEGLYTLGYNCMSALYFISKKYNFYRDRLEYAHKILKKHSSHNEICKIGISLKYKIKKNNKNFIFYTPRKKNKFELIFILGLIKFPTKEIKKIIENKIIKNFIQK
jgi:2-aminoethylphosphonate-pyruvate transaminase